MPNLPIGDGAGRQDGGSQSRAGDDASTSKVAGGGGSGRNGEGKNDLKYNRDYRKLRIEKSQTVRF